MNNEEKRRLFEAHLQEQSKRREEQLEQKKKEESKKLNPQQDMLYIQRTFKDKEKVIAELSKKYRQKQIPFEELQQSYLELKQYYIETSYVLMTYDRQFYKEALEKHQTNIIEMKNKQEPRKRFKFSRRNEDFGVKSDQPHTNGQLGSGNASQGKGPQAKQQQAITIPGITNKEHQKILVKKEATDTISSYKIVDCRDSEIELQKTTEILFLKELSNCVIKCALTKSTVFVDMCKNCTFELNCHQLRIHNTYETTFKIFVTSKAIIEDCNEVTFTPYTYEYEGKEQDVKIFERENEVNQWRDIQDFNWLKENQKSPHYHLKE